MYSEKLNFCSFTVDVEDGINISMRDNFKIEMPPTNRVVSNVDTILDMCAKNGVKATFFVLGEVAELFPDLVRKIDISGHEIGIHGYRHDQLFKLTSQQFKHELTRAKELVESIICKKVRGFRAPAFSINYQTSWALPIIAECGFKFDSSIIPTKMGRYGWDGFHKQIVMLDMPGNLQLIEVPLPVVSILGYTIPACGGGYLRYFPLGYTKWAFSKIRKNRPVITYIHPYELDTKKYPEYFTSARKTISVKKSFPLMMYRYGKGSVKGKLNSILKSYDFVPLYELINILDNSNKIKRISLNNISKCQFE